MSQVSFYMFILVSVGFASRLYAQQIPPKLLEQPEKPTVVQMENLLEQWQQSGESLVLKNHPDMLALAERDVEKDLHFNYPLWFSLLKEDAPTMIVSFERTFPGATFVFIGRDMSVYADLFEAFYRQIGQSDRVKRLGMSTATLDTLDAKLVPAFLKTHGIEVQSKYPIIFVDAISKHGGRQARRLLSGLYASYAQQGVPASQLPFKANLLGMRVATTKHDYTPLSKTHEAFTQWAKYRGYSEELMNFEIQFLLYDGIHKNGNKYLNSTEAGYVHWVGSWNGSYGAIEPTANGGFLAIRGKESVSQVRSEYLLYSTKIVEFGRSPDLLSAVKTKAQEEGFTFPLTRPNFIVDPIGGFMETLKQIEDYDTLIKKVEEFLGINIGRLSSSDLADVVLSTLKKTQWKMTDQQKQRLEELIPPLASSYRWKKVATNAAIDDNSFANRFLDLLTKASEEEKVNEFLEKHKDEAFSRFRTIGRYEVIRQRFLELMDPNHSLAVQLRKELLKEQSSLEAKLELISGYSQRSKSRAFELLAEIEPELFENFKNDLKWSDLSKALIQLDAPKNLLERLFKERLDRSPSFAVFFDGVAQMKTLLDRYPARSGYSTLIANPIVENAQRFYQTEHPNPRQIHDLIVLCPEVREPLMIGALETSFMNRSDIEAIEDILPGIFFRNERLKQAIKTFKDKTKNGSFWSRLVHGEPKAVIVETSTPSPLCRDSLNKNDSTPQ